MLKDLFILKIPFRFIAKYIYPARKLMRKLIYLWRRSRYFLHGIGKKTDDKLIVFESFNGKNFSDTPLAVYEYMMNEPKYNDFKFVWVFNDPDKYIPLLSSKRTRVVKHNSNECEKVFSNAKYWILNYRALDHLIPRSNQVYVQCWHGIPLKRLGYDIEVSDNAMNSKSEIRSKYYTDSKRFKYLLSPCAKTSEIFKSAWNLNNSDYESKIIELGYPRNDVLMNFKTNQINEIKNKLGIGDVDKKIILYAPTWRDNQHSINKGYTYKLNIDFDMLKKSLEDEYLILFRAHYLVRNFFDFDKYNGFVYDVSDVDNINELFLASDLLITDYSSVLFDYAILEKPIIFFMYDLKEYSENIRGFYLNLNELPGEIVETESELIKAIYETKKGINIAVYKDFNNKYNYLNDGNATKRFVEEVIDVDVN